MNNLFTLDNARDLSRDELVSTFLPTSYFENLLAPKNQIVIGSRGSGKTALLKMLSHDHLSRLEFPLAKEIIKNQTYIGIFISMKTKFTGGLKNKNWQPDEDKENYFQWLMNLASCFSLLDALKSCLKTYTKIENERITKELEISRRISKLWFPKNPKLNSIRQIEKYLNEIRILKSQQEALFRVHKIRPTSADQIVGLTFDIDLFEPLKVAAMEISDCLGFPDSTSWFICIDEIEILEKLHHRILNSFLRSNNDNFYFKFSTLPYAHYTLETNLSVQLDYRDDFNYLYIDQDKFFKYRVSKINNYILELYTLRAKISKPNLANLSLFQLFGKSKLIDPSVKTNIPSGEKYTYESLKELSEENNFLRLLYKHSSKALIERAIELLNTNPEGFHNQIGRKMKGLLFLKDEYKNNRKGKRNIELYSGERMISALGDANPRKLIRIFDEMIKYIEKEKIDIKAIKKEPIIPLSVQNFIVATIAENELNAIKNQEKIGNALYQLISTVGEYMSNYIHENKLTTEQISSIEIPKKLDYFNWEVVKRAVQKGILYPNISIKNPNMMPINEGKFHLAYNLSPKYFLLPRKGDSRSINSIINIQLEIFFND